MSEQTLNNRAGVLIGTNGPTKNFVSAGTFSRPKQESLDENDLMTEEEIEMVDRIRQTLKKRNKITAMKYFWHKFEETKLPELPDDFEEKREVEEELRKNVPLASFWDVFGFLEGFQTKVFFLVGCLASIVSGLVYPAIAYLFSAAFSDLTNASNDLSGVYRLVYIFLGLGGGAFVASLLQNSLLEIAAMRASRTFSLRWFRALLRQDMAFFDVYEVSNIAALMSTNSREIKNGLGMKFGEGIQYTICTIGGLSFAFYSNWRVSLLIIVMLPFVGVSANACMRFNQGRAAFGHKAYSKAGGVAQQTITNIKTVLSLNAIPEMIDQYKKATSSAYSYAVIPLWKEGLANGFLYGSFIFLFLGLTVYGSRLIYLDVNRLGCDPSNAVEGNLSCPNNGPEVFSAMLGVAFAGQGIVQIASFLKALGNARVAAYPALRAIRRSLKNNPQEQVLVVSKSESGTPVLQDATLNQLQQLENKTIDLKINVLPLYQIDSSSSAGLTTRINGAISFQNVCFSYPTRPDQPVFEDFTLDIPAGATVAIVGPSGSGKSTLVSLLERFYDPNWGRILVDGIDIKKMNLKYFREHIGFVRQEPSLFSGTISKNIAKGLPGATQQQIESAAKLANAHKFITSFPKGYKTILGGKGAQLSGGQKQLIAIAQVLLKNPEILLLDEATSELDNESELIVQEAIDKLLKESTRTSIIIAHRLSTIRKADIIIFLKNGQVEEKGTHEELMESPIGLYRNFFQIQSMLAEDSETNDMTLLRNSSLNVPFENQIDNPTTLIEFKDVKFSYPSRPEKLVLNKINLKIKKGETIAFVGPSGGGKSTIGYLIERFYDPNDGEILFEGKKIRNLNVGYVRHQIGYVEQEPTLFNGSVATNISCGSGRLSKENIVEASMAANANDFITSFPDKYDTEVGDRGTQLSGGQKQQIAIARALVKKPKILLLDESTSALDSQSEKVVQEALDKWMSSSEHTTIVIAHRLYSIRNADRIAYIADGVVKELGTHDELISKKNGRYRRLVGLQQRSPIFHRQSSMKVNPILEEDAQNEKKIKKRFRRNDKNESFDPKWARQIAKKDANFLITGSVGIILSGVVFPAWGIIFGFMVKTLFYPVLPCNTEVIFDGIPPDHDCSDISIPACFTSCDDYWEHVANDIESDSFALVGYWSLVIIFCIIGNTLSFIGFGTAVERMNKRIRDDTFTSLVRQEVAFFDTKSIANIAATLEEDATKIHKFSDEPIRIFLLCLSSIVIGIAISAVFMWQFALALLVVLPLMGFAMLVEMKLIGVPKKAKDGMNYAGSPGGIAIETFVNMKTVASLNMENECYESFCKALRYEDEKEIQTGIKTGFTRALSILIQQCTNAFQFWWGGWLLNRYDTYTFQDFLISMFALLFSLFALGSATGGIRDREEAFQAATRIYDLIHRESKNDPLTKLRKSSNSSSAASQRSQGRKKLSRKSSQRSSASFSEMV